MSTIKTSVLNKSSNWEAQKIYKVNQVVKRNGAAYQNTTGINSDPENLTDWILIKNISEPIYSQAQIDSFLELKQNKYGPFVIVQTLADLPAPITGDITLLGFTAYLFINNIDLIGNRLICSENTAILGTTSENAKIISTGLSIGTALINSIYTIPIKNISIEHAIPFNLVGNGTTAIDWQGVNFYNAVSSTISNYANVIIHNCVFIDSKNMRFDGTIGTIGINGCLFTNFDLIGDAAFYIADTATITRRIKIESSAFVIGASATGLYLDASATVLDEAFRIDFCDFSGGGLYIGPDVPYNDSRASFTRNKGITNSSEIAQYYMHGNATTTTIGAIATPVKVTGTTTSSAITERFTNTNNRATYNGALTRKFIVSTTVSLTSGNNNQIGGYIAKNGVVLIESQVFGTTSGTGRAENIAIIDIIELNPGDYIEVFVENETSATDILVSDLNLIIR
jgi:hypothetical protein